MASLTNARSPKSSPKTSLASSNATSSPGLASGPSVSAAPAGPTIDLFGPVPVRAVPSALPASGKASTTRATFGRNGFGSSASAGLTCSLVNSLRMRTRGSILFRLTWNASVTPSRRLIYRLRASGARTSVSDLASWPTPTMPSGGQTVPPGTTAGGRKPDGSKAQVTLEMVARLAPWPTTRWNDGDKNSRTPAGAEAEAEAERKGGPQDLSTAAMLASWATPATRDYRTPNLGSFADRGGAQKGEQLNNQVIHQGPALTGSSAEIAAGARLNPAHARWLMRIPPAWDACAVTAMPSTLRRSRS